MDIVKSSSAGFIQTGEPLGAFTVQTAEEGSEITIARGSENGYLINSVIEAQTGEAGSYTVGDTLPSTKFESKNMLLVFSGLTLISAGLLIYLTSPFGLFSAQNRKKKTTLTYNYEK